MRTRSIIKRDLLTEMVNAGLNSKALNDICDAVENMNDNHLVGVVVDTLLDLRDILRLNPGDGRINYYRGEIAARYEAVIYNMRLFNGYGMMQNSAANTKLARINQLKEMIAPLLDSAIALKITSPSCGK